MKMNIVYLMMRLMCNIMKKYECTALFLIDEVRDKCLFTSTQWSFQIREKL